MWTYESGSDCAERALHYRFQASTTFSRSVHPRPIMARMTVIYNDRAPQWN